MTDSAELISAQKVTRSGSAVSSTSILCATPITGYLALPIVLTLAYSLKKIAFKSLSHLKCNPFNSSK